LALDPTVIEEAALAPALNTSTKAAQPVPTTLSNLLEVIQHETILRN